MILRRTGLSVLALFSCAALLEPATAAYRFEHHLFGNDIRDLVVTDEHIFWATTSGVVRMAFSDSSFTLYRKSDRGMPSDSINAIALDGNGDLWCGTNSQGIVIVRASGGFAFIRTFDGLPDVRVLGLATGGGRVMAGTEAGFVVFEGEAITASCTVIDPCVDELPSLVVQSARLNGAETWVGTAGGPARETSGGSFEAVTDGLGNAAVNDFAERGDTLWVGTGDGAYRLAPGDSTWTSTGGIGGDVTSLLVSPIGLFAASPGGQRVYRWSGSGWEVIGSAFTSAERPRALAVGPDGTIWCGTGNGLRAWNEAAGRFDAAIRVDGTPDARVVWSVATGSREQVWIGYRGAAVATPAGTTWKIVTDQTSAGGLERRDVQDVLIDSDGNVFFAHCCCTGPGCFVDRARGDDPDAFDWLRIPARNVRTMVERGGRVYMGSGAEDPAVVGEDGLMIWSEEMGADSVFTISAQGSPLRSNTITALAFTPDGKLWIGQRQRGVDVWSFGSDPFDPSDDTWRRLGTSEPVESDLISNEVLSIAAAGNRVWIGTALGVTLYENGLQRGSWSQSSLPSPFITALAVTADESAWAGSMAGLVRFVPNALGTFDLERHRFPKIANDRVYHLSAGGSAIWIAHDRGVTVGRPGVNPADLIGGKREGSVYPNPFRPAMHPGLRLVDVSVPVEAAVYDAAGALVARRERVEPGGVVWDGRVEGGGAPAAPGIYVVVARADALVVTARVAIAR